MNVNRTPKFDLLCYIGLLWITLFQISTEFIIRRTKLITKLLGKPKFFVFQCCQGSETDYLVSKDQEDRKSSEGSRTKIHAPSEDTYILNASPPGKVSYR